MKLTLTARALITVATGAALILPLSANAAESGRAPATEPGAEAPGLELAERSIAKFEGRDIDLSKSWEDATACWVHQDLSVTCYRTEAELDVAVALEQPTEMLTEASAGLGEGFARANGFRAYSCSTSARLYKGSFYSYSLLYISSRHTWINMSWFGFDNTVSSYKIGACSMVFRSGSYGGGSTYWGGTSAWTWKSSMGSWDNVLSSVYMY